MRSEGRTDTAGHYPVMGKWVESQGAKASGASRHHYTMSAQCVLSVVVFFGGEGSQPWSCCEEHCQARSRPVWSKVS